PDRRRGGRRHRPRRRVRGGGRPVRHGGHPHHHARRRDRQGPRPLRRLQHPLPPQLGQRRGRGPPQPRQLGRPERGAAQPQLTGGGRELRYPRRRSRRAPLHGPRTAPEGARACGRPPPPGPGSGPPPPGSPRPRAPSRPPPPHEGPPRARPEIGPGVAAVRGPLVDEPAGLRAGPRERAPSLDASGIEKLLSLWQRHIAREQRDVVDGVRPYVPSDVLDLEAARLAADAAGAGDPAAVAALARAGRRLPPWSDTVAGLALLAERFPVIGLSNASRTALLELSAHAGLRWHQAMSAEDARTY